MSRALWLRFCGASILLALLLSGLYFILIYEVAGRPSDEVQHSVYLFLARIVEQPPYAASIRKVQDFGAESPAMALDLWVMSDTGTILAASTPAAPPARLLRLQRPRRIHDVTTRGRFFSGNHAIAIVRLDAATPTYLLVYNRGTPARGTFLILVIFFIATLVGAIFAGLLLATLYLRGRSRQAKRVIAQIEAGDLGARFDADRLDAIGGLMFDFNRMADEIQRLVARLQTTERTRRELLQELGHDLRTPLTSLRTATETLAVHGETMSAAERGEFMRVVTGELAYFRKLIDDLFFIAEIDEPRYRTHAERIDLLHMLRAELEAAQGASRAMAGDARGIRFELGDAAGEPQSRTIAGDPYLVARLFRNALENAARHARSRVHAALVPQRGGIDVVIEDDGAGMSREAIARFGQRRSQRFLDGSGTVAASLGLGSVIIQTIVDLHHGHLALSSNGTNPEISGTRMTISFPLHH